MRAAPLEANNRVRTVPAHGKASPFVSKRGRLRSTSVLRRWHASARFTRCAPPNACGIHIRCTNAARASVNAGQQVRAAMLDHLGGDADGDLLGRLRLDGNADGHVHLCDLVFGEPRLGELRVHERRLLLAA